MNQSKTLQLNILRKYFSFHGNVATLELVYATFDELINQNFGNDHVEKLNDKLFADIREAVALLPKKYKLNLHIVIRDFGTYEPAECERIIQENVRLAVYTTIKDNWKKMVSGWSLIGVGALTLLVSYLLRNLNLWFDLINISGTLFVWEGVNQAFIEKNAEVRAMKTLAKTINQITIQKA